MKYFKSNYALKAIIVSLAITKIQTMQPSIERYQDISNSSAEQLSKKFSKNYTTEQQARLAHEQEVSSPRSVDALDQDYNNSAATKTMRPSTTGYLAFNNEQSNSILKSTKADNASGKPKKSVNFSEDTEATIDAETARNTKKNKTISKTEIKTETETTQKPPAEINSKSLVTSIQNSQTGIIESKTPYVGQRVMFLTDGTYVIHNNGKMLLVDSSGNTRLISPAEYNEKTEIENNNPATLPQLQDDGTIKIHGINGNSSSITMTMMAHPETQTLIISQRTDRIVNNKPVIIRFFVYKNGFIEKIETTDKENVTLHSYDNGPVFTITKNEASLNAVTSTFENSNGNTIHIHQNNFIMMVTAENINGVQTDQFAPKILDFTKDMNDLLKAQPSKRSALIDDIARKTLDDEYLNTPAYDVLKQNVLTQLEIHTPKKITDWYTWLTDIVNRLYSQDQMSQAQQKMQANIRILNEHYQSSSILNQPIKQENDSAIAFASQEALSNYAITSSDNAQNTK